MKVNNLKFKNLLVFLLFFFTNNIYAQIVYTNVTDTTITRTTSQSGTLTYLFDINNDNINDYNIAVQAIMYSSPCISINPPFKTNLKAWAATMPSYSNQIGLYSGYTANVPDSTFIDASAFIWSFASQNFLSELTFSDTGCVWDSLSNGYWISGDSNYIALQFKIGSSIYYGWLHVFFQSEIIGPNDFQISLTVLDYAYNSIAGQGILAGDDGLPTAIPPIKNFSNQISVFPNPATNKICLPEFNSSEISLFTANGSLLEKFFNQSSLDITVLKPGLYYLKITTSDKSYFSGFTKQ